MDLIIGSHVSFKSDKQLLGCVEEAIGYGANAFMFYTGAPQNTMRVPIKDEYTKLGYELMKKNNIDINNIIVHAPYIVNLGNIEKFDFSVSFLISEIKRCAILGVKYLVLHPGSALDYHRKEVIDNIIKGLNIILDNDNDVTILLETMSGKGSEIGNSFEEIGQIIKGVDNKNKIGVCLDTCHINDAGYDISKFDEVLKEFDKIIGLNKLKCVHINDSKNIINSRKDRHENIGYGTLGFDNLINIIYNNKVKDVPKILETPYVTKDDNIDDKIYPPYKFEIKMIKNKEFDSKLFDNIRKYYAS